MNCEVVVHVKLITIYTTFAWRSQYKVRIQGKNYNVQYVQQQAQ